MLLCRTLQKFRRTQNDACIWGSFMKDLVIELILIAMIAIPMVADSLEPCRAVRRDDSEPIRKLRRTI
jgi:hypothetical protein